MKRKFKVLTISAITAAALGAVVLGGSIAMNAFPAVMDGVFGQGEQIVTKREGSEDWEGNYIDAETKNPTESWNKAKVVNNQIASEGITLLKNEGKVLPLAAGTKITVLGRNCGHHVTAPTDDVANAAGGIQIPDALAAVGFDVNQSAWNWYKTFSQSNDGGSEIDPSDPEYIANVASTYANYGSGVALIVLRRSYSEGSDPSTNCGDQQFNRTALSLENKELNLIEEACQKFSSVIMAISSPNAMELAFLRDGGTYHDPFTNKNYDFSKVKGAYWIGGIGITGAEAFSKIIKGDINPSGHLVDTYVRDNLNDIPANRNYGKFTWSYKAGVDTSKFYCPTNFDVEYEEGIYVGYRYFETAAYEASKNNFVDFDYNRTVIYPFGYGLSYTTFDYSFVGAPTLKDDVYTFTVKVKNTGNVAGKTPVQIYVNAPYTAGGIEKAHVALAGFAKTGIIQAGGEETVTVNVEKDYMASYDYKVNKCYVLDEGDYNFILSENAHSWANYEAGDNAHIAKVHINKTVYKGDNKRRTDKVAAENLFDRDLNWKFKEYNDADKAGSSINMTRANFKDSYPAAPTDAELVATDYLVEAFTVYEPGQDYSNNLVSPYHDVVKVTEKQEVGVIKDPKNPLQLVDLRGMDFDDPSWKTFIDQLSLDELKTAFAIGGWSDRAISALGVPKTVGGDSPSGLVIMRGVSGNTKFHYPYCAEVLLTATWNVELARAYGDALGEEAQAQRSVTVGGQAINYLFGAGANTHRTPFGGRNHEYFSEDPYIAGKILAAEASGAGEKGLTMLVKHCALNEQETVRQGEGEARNTTYTSFVNEQALREIYMKPWEIYAKEATRNVRYYGDNGELVSKKMSAASAIMTSYNRVGGVWSGASPIISGILRKECGFTGTSFTDAGGTIDGYMNTDYGLVTEGTSSCLMDSQDINKSFKDASSDNAIYHLKNAAHYKLFNVCNGNAVIGLTPGASFSYTTAPWQIGLTVAYIVYGVIVAGLVGLTVFFFVSKSGNVEKAKAADDDDE